MAYERVLFIALARGGSKGVPGKNLRCVGGVPLVGRMARLGKACLSRLGDSGRVIVSTDSDDIAAAARQYGAETPFVRPTELARDLTPSRPVVVHALDWFAERGEHFDAVVLLQPTTPLTSVSDVLGCLDLFRRLDGAPVVAVAEPHQPTDFHFSLDGTRLVPTSNVALVDTRQHREEQVALATSVYVSTPDWIRENDHWVVAGKTHGFRVSSERAIDIDTELGLVLNEAAREYLLPWRQGQTTIIAEAGVNHNGDRGMALELIDAAAECGADAVKFQAFKVSECMAAAAPQAAYQKRNVGQAMTQTEMFTPLEFGRGDFALLQERCSERGVLFCASVFDRASLREYVSLEPPFVKVPSGEITNLPLLADSAASGLPVMLSTGMSTLGEVVAAVEALRRHGAGELCLLHCTSEYPACVSHSNLLALRRLADTFGVPVGFSDHTVGVVAACTAVGLGARVFEKHFTLDHRLPGPDQVASSDPGEFRGYVEAVRQAASAIGDGAKRPVEGETETASVARKSVVVRRPLPKGHLLLRDDLACKRPGTGISPMSIDALVGRELARDVPVDCTLNWGDLR